MADKSGKTPSRGIFDRLGLGQIFGASGKGGPAAGLVGEPAEPPAARMFRERLSALDEATRTAYERFMNGMPVGQPEGDGPTDFKDQIHLPVGEIAFSTDHGKKRNNEDGVFVDPLLDFGVVVDGLSHGGNGRMATEAALQAFKTWTRPEQAGMLKGELNTRKLKDTPENRLKVMGRLVHAVIRQALGENEGGVVVAGTQIEGSKLYSFVLGDAMNIVVRNEKVVFCSRPTSRLQRFADIYSVPPKDLKQRVDAYLATTPIDKIRSELGYSKKVELDRIKQTIWSDPVRVLGYDDVDMEVDQFDLQPDDVIISVTDGITESLGVRTIPTKKDVKSGQWKFDPDYQSLLTFPKLFDPLIKFGQSVGRSAEETRDNILKLFVPGGVGARGQDHKTILVRRQPLPPRARLPEDADRTEHTPFTPPVPFTPPGRVGPSLPPIGPDYADEKTPVDPARKNLPRYDEEDADSWFPPPLPPLPPLPRTPLPPAAVPPPILRPAPAVTPAPPRTEMRSAAVPPPLPPEAPTARPAPAAFASLFDEDGSEPWFPPAPLPDAPPPLPSREDEAKLADIARLKDHIRRAALTEFDTRHTLKDEQTADAILWEIWDVQDRLADLELTPKVVRATAEVLRVRKNFLRKDIEGYDRARPYLQDNYTQHVAEKSWGFAFNTLYSDLYVEQLLQIQHSYALAWLEGEFELLKGKPFELREAKGTSSMQVVEIFPPNDPDMPNMVVMHVLNADGKPTKRMALTKFEWQRKLTQGVEITIPRETIPFEASKFIPEVQAAVDTVRLWFRAGNYAQKLEQGQFSGTAYEQLYLDLRTVLEKYPQGYVPASVDDVKIYALWADMVEHLQARIQELTNPKI